MVSKNKFKTFFFEILKIVHRHKKAAPSCCFQKQKQKQQNKKTRTRSCFPPDIWLLVPSDERLQVGNMFISDRVELEI